MSTLTLVRHGQAQPFQGTQATLSTTGERQAAKLAEFWLRNGTRFDEVYSGTLARQVTTEEIAGECFRAAGEIWPTAVRDQAWNEYDATGVLQHLVPADANLNAMAARFEQARGTPEEYRTFQRMFEGAMGLWLEGTVACDRVEPWTAFRRRVSGAIQRIMAGPAGRRVVVFTSGGPIGFAVHWAVQAPARSFLDVNWRVRNTSVTNFVFDRSRLTLDGFNSISHLDEAGLWTYR